MEHNVQTYRAAGLEAKRSKTQRGAPCILVRDPKAKMKHQRKTWWAVDKEMFAAMREDGVREGFDRWFTRRVWKMVSVQDHKSLNEAYAALLALALKYDLRSFHEDLLKGRRFLSQVVDQGASR